VHIGDWWGNLKERDNLEALVVSGRIIFRWIFRQWEGSGGGEGAWTWIDLAQDRDWWRALVNATMSVHVP
jgi:hypothetical protein